EHTYLAQSLATSPAATPIQKCRKPMGDTKTAALHTSKSYTQSKELSGARDIPTSASLSNLDSSTITEFTPRASP
ncbi:Hypothetical predicted protein, partial [Pelobates cultripes]